MAVTRLGYFIFSDVVYANEKQLRSRDMRRRH